MQIILCRHGETNWSLSGQHTGLTDLELTEKGKMQAKQLQTDLRRFSFDKVYTSPLLRAKQTCALALPGHQATEEPLAVEWDYGDYEGMTTKEILEKKPGWNLFTDGAPHGESPRDIAMRADHLIAQWVQSKKNCLLFSHGHFIRVFAMRWIGLSPKEARNFALGVGSISVLGIDRSTHVIESWNR